MSHYSKITWARMMYYFSDKHHNGKLEATHSSIKTKGFNTKTTKQFLDTLVAYGLASVRPSKSAIKSKTITTHGLIYQLTPRGLQYRTNLIQYLRVIDTNLELSDAIATDILQPFNPSSHNPHIYWKLFTKLRITDN